MKRNANLVKRPTKFYIWTFLLLCLTLDVFAVLGKQDINNEAFREFEYVITGFLAGELIVRIVMFLECVVMKRYNGGPLKTAKQIFNFHSSTIIISGGLVSYLSYIQSPMKIDLTKFLIFLCGYAFIKLIKLDESSYLNSVRLENCNGLDYGSGMAYSYFHGYLSIILPDKGDNNDSIKLLMEKYEASEKVKFGIRKLIILVPKYLYCPPDMSDLAKKGNVKMQASKTLLCIERNRAGVQKRTYRNPVYKVIKDDTSEPIYFVVEGATPLLTLYESLKTSSAHQRSYEENKNIIVSQFYHTIKTLVDENPEFRDVCEIVYYDSDEVKNIGRLLLDMMEN